MLIQTATNLDTELHFTCFMEPPEAELGGLQGTRIVKMRRIILRRWEEIGRKSGTGMRFVELNGRREGPIDHDECKD